MGKGRNGLEKSPIWVWPGRRGGCESVCVWAEQEGASARMDGLIRGEGLTHASGRAGGRKDRRLFGQLLLCKGKEVGQGESSGWVRRRRTDRGGPLPR